MDDEIWKATPDYPGYEVSNHGSVRSYHLQQGGLALTPQRLLTARPDFCGYLRVGVHTVDGKAVIRPVHALVAEAFLGPRRPGELVRHLDGVKTNNTPSNLVYGTFDDNENDAKRMQEHPRGEANGRALLTNAKVLEIRERYASGEKQTKLAQDFGVAQAQISQIVRGKRWKHVGGPRFERGLPL